MPRSPSNSGSVSPPRNRVFNRSPQQVSPPRVAPADVENEKQPRLFVSALSLETTEEELRKLFEPHGQIVDFFQKKNERGSIAFITFDSLESAQKAKQCHGTQLNGQSIRVDFAKPRPTNNDRGNNRQRPQRNNGENNRGERKLVCFKCQKEGHFSKECPQTGNNQAEQRQNKPKICFKCKKEGHFSRECPEAGNQNQIQQRVNRPKTCFKCHKEGHLGRDCTQDNANNQNGLIGELKQKFNRPKTCYKCQKEGHFARQCTQNPDNAEEKPFRRQQNYRQRSEQRREVNFNRDSFFKKTIQEIFPIGRQDYVYQEPTDEEVNLNLNKRNDRNTRGMSIEEPEQQKPATRKRSISRSSSPKITRKFDNPAPVVTPQRNIRKRSVSHSVSPPRNRGKNVAQTEKEQAKGGWIDSKQANVSRSRSRSKEKQKVVQRKRSVSPESNSY